MIAFTHQVLWITRGEGPEPHQRVAAIGGRNPDGTTWQISQEAAITGIDFGNWEFFVVVDEMTRPLSVAKDRAGRRYLKCNLDTEDPVSLLALPEGPPSR